MSKLTAGILIIGDEILSGRTQDTNANFIANELINAGIDLIGKDRDNAWMKGMYFTDNQNRIPYTPIHELYGDFKCPMVDEYKNRLDWISIFAW